MATLMANYNEKLDAFTQLKNEVEEELKAGSYDKFKEKDVIINSLKGAVKEPTNIAFTINELK